MSNAREKLSAINVVSLNERIDYVNKETCFCVVPWSHLYIAVNGNTRPCCLVESKGDYKREDGSKIKITDPDVETYSSSDMFKKLRTKFLDNEWPEECYRCQEKEKYGLRSYRQSLNMQWLNNEAYKEDDSLNVQLIDIRLGNLCNLSCRTCGPFSSTTWINEINAINPTVSEEHKLRFYDMTPFTEWPKLDIVYDNILKFKDTITEIKFAGGEPFLHKQVYQIVDRLLAEGLEKKIKLDYNTNITVLPPKLLSYWPYFREVDMAASIDGYGEVNDYIRYPSKWDIIDSNLHTLVEMKKNNANMRLWISATVEVYNIFSIGRLYDYVVPLVGEGDYRVRLNLLHNPEHLNIRILPPEAKKMVTEYLQAYKSCADVPGLIDYMNSEDWHEKYWNKFIDFTTTLDNHRGTSVVDVVPELAPFMRKI